MPRRPRLVMVIWEDINSDPSWQPKDKVELELAKCESVGWLIHKDDKVIRVAGCQNKEDWGSITVIPVVNVIEIEELRKK